MAKEQQRYVTNWSFAQQLPVMVLSFTLLTAIPSLRHTHVTEAASTSSSNNNSDDAIRLLRDVIDPYDSRVRPILNQSNPVQVYTTYNLLNLIEVDQINQRIAINLWVNFSWWDEIRTWNPDDYGGNDVIHPNPKDIWRPKTILTNSVGERDVFKDTDTPLSIYSSGSSRWYTGGFYYFSCGMDLTYFPFDTQTCKADVMAINIGPEISFIPTANMSLTQYVQNGEWDLKSSTVASSRIAVSDDETLTFLFVSITFQRRPQYYLINVFVPTLALSFLSLFGFVVPKDSGERASFAITVLLALAVYMATVFGQLPTNSDTFPLISIYIFSLLCLSMLSVLIIVCQLRLMGFHCSDEKNSEESNESFNSFRNGKEYSSTHTKDNKTSMTHTLGENDGNSSNIVRSRQSNRVTPISNSTNDQKRGLSSSDKIKENNNNNNNNSNNNNNNNSYDTKAGMRDLWGDASSVRESSASIRFFKRLRRFYWSHDDAILMSIFSILWAIFTIAFVASISQYPKH